MPKKNWSDLSPRGKTAILTLASVQISLAATAWADLASRPAEQVNGSKPNGPPSSPSTSSDHSPTSVGGGRPAGTKVATKASGQTARLRGS